MADTQPTEREWSARPYAAASVRALTYLIPVVASLITGFVISMLLPAATTTAWAVARWVAILAACTITVLVVDRFSRRLLPLATLLKLSLAFPDKTPSRFRIAIRVGTTRQLRRRLEHEDLCKLGETPGEAAERLLELTAQLSLHDRLTRGHSERVRAYTHLIGRDMGLTGEELDKLRWSGLLHDIGKLAVPEEILNKPGRLTDEEFETIKTHPMIGKTFVEPLSEWLGESCRAVWEHHERYDGGGYPQGLVGSEMALASRIVSVADSFDVMTSQRSYKAPMSAVDARAELVRCSGTQFDPVVVRTFLNVSLGRFQTTTTPLSWMGQLAFFPRSFIAQAGASFAAGAAIVAGTIAGTSNPLAAAAPAADQEREADSTATLVLDALDEDEQSGRDDIDAPAATTPPTPDTPVVAETPADDPDADAPVPDVPTPDVPIPTPPTPDVPTPDAPTPDAPTPDAPTPDAPTPDAPTPEVPLPDVPTPEVPLPEVPTPELPLPESPIPELPLPDVPLPDVPLPELPTPDVPLPELPTPELPTPDVPLPDVPLSELPTSDVPTPALPTAEPPTPELPTPELPTPELPTF